MGDARVVYLVFLLFLILFSLSHSEFYSTDSHPLSTVKQENAVDTARMREENDSGTSFQYVFASSYFECNRVII